MANMGPTWGLSSPDGPHVGPMNISIRGVISQIVCCILLLMIIALVGYIVLMCQAAPMQDNSLNNPQCIDFFMSKITLTMKITLLPSSTWSVSPNNIISTGHSQQ